MNESQDGSSAARRALSDPDDPPGRGFFGRIMGALGGADTPQASPPQGQDGQPLVAALPGLAGLSRLRVEDVAIPEAEIVAVPVEIDRDALVGVFRESGFSRLPVYGETLDQPLGLLLLKDLALEYGFNGGTRAIDLKPLLRPLLYVPPSMPLVVLLQKMQTSRIHMALVIDEYGGVVGLVTIEDLIEQVVGEIEDEHDEEAEGWWVREASGSWVVQARTPLEEFEAEIGQSLTETLDQDEIDTLGGLVFLLAGRVPARGEVIPHPDGVEFEVLEADPRRVKRLRVRAKGRPGLASGPALAASETVRRDTPAAAPDTKRQHGSAAPPAAKRQHGPAAGTEAPAPIPSAPRPLAALPSRQRPEPGASAAPVADPAPPAVGEAPAGVESVSPSAARRGGRG